MLVNATGSKRTLFLALGAAQVFFLFIFWTAGGHYKQISWPSSVTQNSAETRAHSSPISSGHATSHTIPAEAQNGAEDTKTASHEQESANRDIMLDVGNSTLGFQKIFVINLPNRSDLRDSMVLASAVSDIDIEFIDGVKEADVDRKTLPPGANKDNMNGGSLGCWRAHLDFLRTVVEQNLGSALVLESDADWDVRIKTMLYDFAKASRLLVQPLKEPEVEGNTTYKYLDRSYPNPQGMNHQEFRAQNDLEKTVVPTSSPYGDLGEWDVLWLGHCGMRWPTSEENVPIGRALIENDPTVVRHVDYMPQLGAANLRTDYPEHVRVVSRARMNTCTSAYAVSQAGARKLLYEFSVHMSNNPIDLILRSACHGSEGRETRTCLSVQPELFQFHRPRGSRASWSDIDNHGTEEVKFAYSPNIRWSTKVNFDKLVNGQTDYVEQYEKGPVQL